MIAATKYLNTGLRMDLARFTLDSKELPLAFIKYQKIEHVIYSLPIQVQDIVVDMLNLFEPIKDNEKVKILIDYKVRDLKKGETGCPIPGWHTDYTENPNREGPPEEHLIFTSHVGTEFMSTPLEVLAKDTHYVEALRRNVDKDFEFLAVEPNTVTGYNRLNIHRCPLMEEDCRRVVIRLSRIFRL